MIAITRSVFNFGRFSSRNIFSNQPIAEYTSLSSSELSSFMQDTLQQKDRWQQMPVQKQEDALKAFIHSLS